MNAAWSGGKVAISRTQRNILRYSSSGIADTGIVPDTGAICHDSPWHDEALVLGVSIEFQQAIPASVSSNDSVKQQYFEN
jgi:hypothetical protein